MCCVLWFNDVRTIGNDDKIELNTKCIRKVHDTVNKLAYMGLVNLKLVVDAKLSQLCLVLTNELIIRKKLHKIKTHTMNKHWQKTVVHVKVQSLRA